MSLEAPVQQQNNLLKNRTFTETEIPGIVLDQNGQRCIDFSLVTILPDRARKEYKNLLELADSMKRCGVLSPIVLRKDDQKYTLVAGGRRSRAWVATGEKYIPFTFQNEDSLCAKESELEENLQREGLNWTEEVRLKGQIHELKIKKYGTNWNLTKTSEVLGESLGSVHKKLNIDKRLQADPTLKDKLAHLPLSAAIKEIEKMDKREKAGKQIESGQLLIIGDVINCSCIDGIAGLKDQSQDLLLTDPPFGNPTIARDQGKTRTSMVYTGIIKPSDNMEPEAMKLLIAQTLVLLKQKMKTGSHFYIFFAFEFHAWLIEQLEKNLFIPEPKPIIWNKTRMTSMPQGYNYGSQYEPVIYGHFKERTKRLNGEGLSDIQTFSSVPVGERLHPFQKPATLLRQFIHASTEKGDAVLDPFAGSGEVIKQAMLLQRRGTGFEIDRDNWISSQLNLGKNTTAVSQSEKTGGN